MPIKGSRMGKLQPNVNKTEVNEILTGKNLKGKNRIRAFSNG